MRESANEAVQKRLFQVLQGRKPHPWGASVHIKRTTITRMLKGHFPDPRALVPMLRIERLSLTWLLSGAGTPYLVLAPPTDREAVQEMLVMLADEPSWEILVAHSDDGFTVALHQPAESTDIDGERYTYTAVEVIGGAACGVEVANLVLGQQSGRTVTQVEMEPSARRRLASGRMGNAELLQRAEEASRGGPGLGMPIALSTPRYLLQQLATSVADPQPDYRSDQEHEVLRIFRGCKPPEREVIMRMLRGLRSEGESSGR